MLRSTIKVFSIWLLAAAFAVSCGKKPAGTPSAAAPAEQKDGVSSVPTPTERTADMELSNLLVSGDVKEVKAKVLDKEADDKTKGLVRIKAFGGPVEISENTRWEVWKPGADTEEQKPESNGWASSERAVPVGTWDVRMHYEESPVCKAEGWIRGINVVAGKMWKAEAILSAAMQYVRIFATVDGKDVADNALVELFKAGADQEELKPLASFWSTRKQPIASNAYDLRLTYNKDSVKAKAAVKGFAVGGDHGVLKKTIALTKS